MKTFFTADTHFAHERIIGITERQFASIEEHDDAILAGINGAVGYHDRLFILGDFCWRAPSSYLAKIVCKNVHLIVGNHDRASTGKLFKTVADTAIVKIGEHKVFLSHYAHAFWPASHYGSFHLYGHNHSQREGTLDAVFPGRRSMDVGVDNAMRLRGEYLPFSEDDILFFLGDQPGHDPVEFYSNLQAARQA